ncbi:MAG: hypothetical protein LBN99_03095 [Oscillospiraceae bacterium]|nr:hypothetical protein [Oscillospiraceae bacterium]
MRFLNLTRWKKYASALVAAFLVVSFAVVYASVSSGVAPRRGELPSVSEPLFFDELSIPDESVPLAAEPPEVVEEPEPTPIPEPTPDPNAQLRESARAILSGMTEEERLYQLFFVTPEGLTGYKRVYQAGAATQTALEKTPVGGIIYFSKNIDTPEQTAEMLQKTQEYSKIPLFLGVDEEGGSAAQISSQRAMGFAAIPPMAQIGASGDAQGAYDAGAAIGNMLKTLGFNADFAPVADVLVAPGNAEIGDRAFGADPATVSAMTARFTEGLRGTGAASSLKHFPGIGSAPGALPRTLDEMRESEFVPFRTGILSGSDFVVVSHAAAASLDASGAPSSLSRAVVTELLRSELGFEKIIITESLSDAGFLTKYPGGEASVLALEAGADMLLTPKSLPDAVKAIQAAIEDGRLTRERIDESVLRILMVKLERGIIA